MKLQKPLLARKPTYYCTNCGYKTFQQRDKAATLLRFIFGFGKSVFIALPFFFMHGVTCPRCKHFSFVRPNSFLGRHAIKQEQKLKADKDKYKRHKRRRKISKYVFYGTLFLIGVILVIINIYLERTSNN